MTVPLHTLQAVLPPYADAPPDLYWRARAPDGAPLPPNAPLPEGARLSLDTWVNSLPLAFRRRHCGPEDIALALDAGPPGRAALFDWTPSRGRRALAEGDLAPGDALALPPEAEGRVWAELTLESGGPAPALRWATPAPPRREVSLTVGLVTLGAEPALAETLRGLAAVARDTPALRRVFLVHQGEPPLSAEIAQSLPPDRLTILRQPNLGGAGGFARTLAEAMALDPAPGHHLLMDDDIRLDPRMIPRAIGWLERLEGAPALGGAMLDALDPGRAHECGARLARYGVVKPFAQGADLRRPAGEDPAGAPRDLNLFAEPPALDFNGWWFFAVPLAAARRAGLPAPVFLRGDDLDYSRRLTRAGAPTLTPPGLFVWHEPFYAKATSWQHYYDLRNRLIHAAVHPETEPVAPLDLLERLLTPALTQDYATARWRLRAVDDFLGGPAALLALRPDALHRAVVSHAKHLAPEPLDSAPPGLPVIETGRPRPATAAAHASAFARALLRLALPHRQAPAAVIRDAAVHPGNLPSAGYIRAGRNDAWLRLHRPRRALALRLTAEALAAALRYALAGPRARRAWAEGLEEARSPQAWAARFAAKSP